MGTFSQTVKREPPARHVIRVCDWASSYQDRPLVDMPVGIRMLSDEELESCRKDADKAAEKKLNEGAESFIKEHERQLIRSAVSRALCDQNDSTKPHEHFPCPDEQLDIALRPETIVTLFDLVERTQLENSPVFAPATNDDIADLMIRLGDGALETLDELRAARVRRLLAFCLDELINA